MITGSHNPKGWNGLKLAAGLSSTLVASEIQELYDIIAREDFVEGHGDYAEATIFDDYAKDLVSRVKIKRPLKIVIDTGNGTAGAFAPRIFRDAGVTVIEQFTELDPDFPTTSPIPRARTPSKRWQRARGGADMGLAFDGDATASGSWMKRVRIWPDRRSCSRARCWNASRRQDRLDEVHAGAGRRHQGARRRPTVEDGTLAYHAKLHEERRLSVR
jgi:phosphomannomutase/phosphoglucomutase